MAHPNEELVRKGFDAFSKGDVDTLRALFAQDAVWHAPGRSPLSGDHRGVDAILGFFAQTMELTGGSFRVEFHDVLANDEHAVSLYVARGEASSSAGRRQPCCGTGCPPTAATPWVPGCAGSGPGWWWSRCPAMPPS
jgi:ketosteroid isomerase-like protein